MAESVSFYKKMFSSDTNRDMRLVIDQLEPNVGAEINEELTKDIYNKEIQDTVMQIGALKATGPDGYPGLFYQKYWSIVGQAVRGVVKEAFAKYQVPSNMNSTNIILIPKVPIPETMSDLWPISCCNFIYKTISKILVNRLKQHLLNLISPNQSALIEGRQIQDNIIVAHEAFQNYRLWTKGKKAPCALKVDMHKAHDRVEWDFLEDVFTKLGFRERWVMMCVKTVSYNVTVNGKGAGTIMRERGVRHGDPLSPYIFVIIADVLSLMLNKTVNMGFLKGVKLNLKCPTLSHLFFADDSLLFYGGNQNKLRECLQNSRSLL